MSGTLGMMGPRILDIRKFRTYGGGGAYQCAVE